MAKKKTGEKTNESRVAEADADRADVVEAAAEETLVEAATPGYVAEEAAFLAAEVQAFLNKRSELADRLAREIEATERRLEDLRRTAALLSPPLPAKPEKKAKKPAPKKSARKAEGGSDAETATETLEPANPLANDGAAA